MYSFTESKLTKSNEHNSDKFHFILFSISLHPAHKVIWWLGEANQSVKGDVSPPYGVLGVGLDVHADGHREGEPGELEAQLRSFLAVPTAEGFTQGQGQLFSCTTENMKEENKTDLWLPWRKQTNKHTKKPLTFFQTQCLATCRGHYYTWKNRKHNTEHQDLPRNIQNQIVCQPYLVLFNPSSPPTRI